MILDPIVFADAEQFVIDVLVDALPTLLPGPAVPVNDTVGADLPESVRVFRTGGPRRDLVTDQPQITVECRALRESRAERMAAVCRAIVNDLEGQEVAGVQTYEVGEFSGPSNLPDPDFPQGYRYTQTFQLDLRAP